MEEQDDLDSRDYASVSDCLTDILDHHSSLNFIVLVVLIVLFFVSAVPLASKCSSPETYASTIQTLDDKRDTVLGFTAASAGISAAISAIPGDAGTPIAQKLMDLSTDFLVVLAAIYLEKYLLTTLGFVAFRVMVPGACICAVLWVCLRHRSYIAGFFSRTAWKLLLLGIVLTLTVPASVFISDKIEATYRESIDETMDAANATAAEAEKAESDSKDSAEDEGTNGLLDWIASISESVTSGAEDIAENARNLVNNFIDALAVMIVTSCVIPILVLVFLLWAAKLLLGLDVSAPMQYLRPRVTRSNRSEK